MSLPAMYAQGPWKLSAPFDALMTPDTTYTNIAQRSFQQIRFDGHDVFELYYAPVGLTREQYDQDDKLATSICTLFSQDHKILEVPDTYIVTYPTGTANGYSRVVVGAEIGIVPNAMSLDYLKAELSGRLTQLVGFEVVVNLYSAPYTGVLTPQQAASFDNVRNAAIGSLTTVYARAETAEQQVIQLKETNKQLTDIILNSGIVIPTA